MILELFILIFVLGFLFLAAAFISQSVGREVLIFYMLAAIFFFTVGITAYDVEKSYCELDSSDVWSCHNDVHRYAGFGYLGYGLGLISISLFGIFMITDFGKMLTPNRG